jgi:hypothetical protein
MGAAVMGMESGIGHRTAKRHFASLTAALRPPYCPIFHSFLNIEIRRANAAFSQSFFPQAELFNLF